MRLLKPLLIVSIILALVEPGVLTRVGDGIGAAFSSVASAAPNRTYQDAEAHQRACTLFLGWQDADARSRRRAADALATVAAEQAAHTDDPAVKALLGVLPDAVGSGPGLGSRSARMLLSRECRD